MSFTHSRHLRACVRFVTGSFRKFIYTLWKILNYFWFIGESLVQRLHPKMGSTFILLFRTCQKNLKPLVQGSSTFFTHNTFLCKSHQHLLGTRNSDSGPGNGQKDYGYAAKGREKSTTLRQRPSFPKSVFAAGTAKRTSEILRKKAALLSQDVEQQDEEPKGRSTRGSGSRTDWKVIFVL